ncbi:MAG: hypothetical protein HOY69_01375 [Streptomyces sp.]|nr:hypothetical protein [Streptomyces sp.]
MTTDVIVVTPNLGGSARALLPIGLDDGRTTTIGVWVPVERDVFRHIVDVGSGKLDQGLMQFDGRPRQAEGARTAVMRRQASSAAAGR